MGSAPGPPDSSCPQAHTQRELWGSKAKAVRERPWGHRLPPGLRMRGPCPQTPPPEHAPADFVLGLGRQATPAVLSPTPGSEHYESCSDGSPHPEGALPGGAALSLRWGARVPRGRRPAQPRQHLLPQLRASAGLHAALASLLSKEHTAGL